MRTPSDKTYKVPIEALIGLMIIGAAMLYIGVKMLQSRMKHSWPW